MFKDIEIIFEDEYLVAINKPNGLLTHKSNIDKFAKTAALQLTRNKINKRIFTTHRIDRKTSGVLIFAKQQKIAAALNKLFAQNKIEKTYIAIVRGWITNEGTINYAIKNDKLVLKNAITNFRCLQQTEMPFKTSKFETSRYSLVKLKPKTGRYHQLRMHMAHIFHPIINDRPHGCNKQNRFFKNNFGINEMMLHAKSLKFIHPETFEEIKIDANFLKPFKKFKKILDFN